MFRNTSGQTSRKTMRRRAASVLLLSASAPLLMAALPYERVLIDDDLPIASTRLTLGGIPQSPVIPTWRPAMDKLGTRLADAELGEMRGKYITPDAVSFFGISMLTSWQDQNGVTTVARLAFNVEFTQPPGSSQAVPQVLVNWVREGDPGMDVRGVSDGYVALTSSPDQVLPVGALDTLNGAGQVNVIAGADNAVGNTMRIAIVPRSAVTDMGTSGMSPLAATQNHTFDDGDQLQFRVADNQIGLVMTGARGADSTMQMVGGDLGQMLQQTILNSDQNHVLNSTSIVFGVNTSVRNLDQINADGALSAMKGFGF